MTEAVIAPPPTAGLRLPGGSGLPANLPAVEPDFPDFLPLRTRLPKPFILEPAETGGASGPEKPVDARLTSGFRLDQNPPPQPGPASGASLRLPIAERSGGVGGGVKGYFPSPKAGDLRKYLYGGMTGSGEVSWGYFPGGSSGRTGVRGRSAVPSSVKRYDLTAWAQAVIELIQKNWLTPPAAAADKDLSVEILVVVLKSGSLSALIPISSSDDRMFDQAAKDAIEESLPFPPLPTDFPESSLEISFVFTRQ